MNEANLILECKACTERHPLEPSYVGWRKTVEYKIVLNCGAISYPCFEDVPYDQREVLQYDLDVTFQRRKSQSKPCCTL